MNRRRFVKQLTAGASLLAAPPLLGGVIGGNAERHGAPKAARDGAPSRRWSQSSLSKGFIQPPRTAAPWVYWVWLGVDTTPEAMTFDLEQMKAKNIAGFILYGNQAGSLPREIPAQILVKKSGRFEYEYVKNSDYDNFHTTPIPFPPLDAWTPRWREHMRYVSREALRLDLQFCLTIGLAGTSGPIPEEYGNQELIWTETLVRGNQEFDGALPADGPQDRASGYRRDVAVLAVPDASDYSASQVINLTAKMLPDGSLRWKPPAGDWKILRFSQSATGAQNQYGIFSDAMSAEATDRLWEATVAPLLQEMSSDERKGLIGLEDDSWEGGRFTWTKDFAEEFASRRGYDLIPYLPLLAGSAGRDATMRRQIERDYKLTISDLMADRHYGRLEQLCKENGLIFFSEAAGPNLYQADLLKTTSKVDVMMAEFWMPSFHRPTPKSRFFARNAACASHIYGSRIDMDEAFTSLGPEWEVSLFDMKPVSDQAFCDGVNRICVHNFSHSPSLTAKPGYVYVAGTHYEPRVTWWEQTPALTAYLARCSFLLQQGTFVADAVFYKGDNIGAGEPKKQFHPTLGKGYDYDCVNTDVLLTRMRVEDEQIVLDDGMRYRVLILPEDQPMPLAALRKLAEMVDAGAKVVGPAPAGLAGLPLREEEPREFQSLVARLWGSRPVSNASKSPIGSRCLISGQSARQALLNAGVPPDFEQTGLSASGEIHWIHRRTKDAEIYFVASQWRPVERLDCVFRVTGRQPELWDPVTGAMRDAEAFLQDGGRTTVPLKFGPCGSIFVIFRRPIPSTARGAGRANEPEEERVALTLSGPWEVSFDPKWGGPRQATFDTLVDWTQRPEMGIRYYSGSAVYRKSFHFDRGTQKDVRVVLDLGELREVGAVRLNGRDWGIVWTKPARLDVTDALEAGQNFLEVKVVNLWPNRLIGDAGLPAQSRFTETNVRKFNSHSPLMPSGLLGPVRLLSVEESSS